MTTESARPSPGGPAARPGLGLLVLAVVLVGLNLRGPIVGIPPLIDQISSDLDLTGTTAGLVTSVPLICFAVGSPLVALLTRRVGLDRAVLLSLVLLGVSVALRPWGGLVTLLLGTVGVGLAITVGNVVVPVLVRRDAGGRTKEVMAASTSSYGVGAALAVAVAVPVAAVVGWRGSTALLAVLVVLALVVWLVRMRRAAAAPAAGPAAGPTAGPARAVPGPAARPGRADGRGPAARPSVWTQPAAWWLALFFGLQSTLFYSSSAWLPPLVADQAGVTTATAGTAVSLFHLLGIAGTLAVPTLLARLGNARRVAVTVAAGWAVLLAGLLLVPGLWLAWVLVGGVAQGAGIGLGLTLVAVRPVDADYGRSVSAMVQGAGYGLAAVGPVLVGWSHAVTDGWATPVLILLAAAALMGVAGLRAGEDAPIGARRGVPHG
ncbi:MFS transporter [Georgenia sp. SYP-B2076]|uniref:MFS transporter n=1 Tax=Georgenia sp. SYP-B2076 TaxID=2495881 RepID=UPI000F8F7BE2|nr:MFS transporter [Georgenia sp. SYP-B2076]